MELKKFCNKYRIELLSSDVRVPKFQIPMGISGDQSISYDTEMLYTMKIPQSALNLLADLDDNFFKYSGNGHEYIQDLIVSHREEALTLKNNPALRELREQYETMLSLCAKNPQNIKNHVKSRT
jgi:hypothetical protein